MEKPAYNFKDFINFINKCQERSANFFIIKGAKETASSDFGLNTDDEILNFIGNDGLEKPEFINTKEWENNPDKKNPVPVDAYHFFSGIKYGYFAFLFNQVTKKWMIKSLKEEIENPDPRNLPFKGLNLEMLGKKKIKDGKDE